MAAESTARGRPARQAAVDRVLADPPVVHYLTYEDLKSEQLSGVHATEEACYRFLAEVCRPGSRTLETGSGISTVLFAEWGAEHRCVTPSQVEADAVLAYCRNHSIPTHGLTFDIVGSEIALVRDSCADIGPLDLVFIDGNHGFPAPMIDWFYGAGRLRKGGILVLDDLQLPAVKVLRSFLDLDPRWLPRDRTTKWAAYERRTDGSLAEDWYSQPFYRMPGSRLRPVGPLEARARTLLRPTRNLAQKGRSLIGAVRNPIRKH